MSVRLISPVDTDPDIVAGWSRSAKEARRWCSVDPAVARARARERDAALFGSPDAVEEMYATRYHPACALYLADCDPVGRADVLIGNDHPARPVLVRT